jgi:copper(I)-binding protein
MIGKCLGLILAGLSLIGPAQAQKIESSGISIVSPWARATPGGAKVGAAFLEVRAAPGAGDKLIDAKSDVAGAVEIHNHVHEGGVMKMRRVDGIDVAGGKSIVLKPGGYHLMLMDLKKPLRQGEKLPLTLVFEKAGEVKLEAAIGPVGATGPGTGGAKRGGAAPKSGGDAHKH